MIGTSRIMVNKRINSKYLSSSGNTELKTRLFRILKHLPALQIGLVVSYKDNTSKVAQIALKCVFDKERVEKDKIPLIEEEIKAYFKEIGFKTINATDYEDMFDLINRLSEDVPQEKIIFNMSNYYNVYDTTGNVVRRYFKTWKDAYTFLCVMSRYDWTIKKIK